MFQMIHRCRHLASIAGLAAAMGCAPSHAQTAAGSSEVSPPSSNSGPYLVTAIGAAHHDVDCGWLSSCERNDPAFKLLAGWRFAQIWAVEGGFLHLGSVRARDGDVRLRIQRQAVLLGAAVHLDLPVGLGVKARGGVASVDSRAKVSSTGSSFSDSERSAEPYLGVALSYAVNRGVSFELAYDRTRGTIDGDSGSVSALTIGLAMRF